MSTRARLYWLTGLAVITGVVLWLSPDRWWFDVRVYRGAVHDWAYGGGRLYDSVLPGSTYGFTYPPFAAVCLVPLAVSTQQVAVTGMLAVNVVATAAIGYWLADPLARRFGWSRWFTFGVTGCLLAMFGPVHETIFYGQVNLILLALVLADLRPLGFADRGAAGRGGGRACGVAIGLATAIKLTPALFICYLLIARRWRAAATAAAVAAAATLLGVLVATQPSRHFWTVALWDTGRVGSTSYVSNQSLMGVVARLDAPLPDRLVWAAAAAVVLGVWAYRARRAAAAGNHAAGFALTAVGACLVSPITWVHHLVWLLPALALVVQHGLEQPNVRRKWTVLAMVVAAYLVLSSGVVWLWSEGRNGPDHPTGVGGFLGSNLFVWIGVALLAFTPTRRTSTVGEGTADEMCLGPVVLTR